MSLESAQRHFENRVPYCYDQDPRAKLIHDLEQHKALNQIRAIVNGDDDESIFINVEAKSVESDRHIFFDDVEMKICIEYTLRTEDDGPDESIIRLLASLADALRSPLSDSIQ